jgi:hypothetical protein
MQTLGRPADASGSAYWANQINSGSMTPQQVASAIQNSSEASNVANIRQAMGTQSGMTASTANSLVNQIYQGNLGTAPSASQLQSLSSQLQAGTLTPQQLITQLQSSPAAQTAAAQAAQQNAANSGGGGGGASGGLGSTIARRKRKA